MPWKLNGGVSNHRPLRIEPMIRGNIGAGVSGTNSQRGRQHAEQEHCRCQAPGERNRHRTHQVVDGEPQRFERGLPPPGKAPGSFVRSQNLQLTVEAARHLFHRQRVEHIAHSG